jgi:hypothetical protein
MLRMMGVFEEEMAGPDRLPAVAEEHGRCTSAA